MKLLLSFGFLLICLVATAQVKILPIPAKVPYNAEEKLVIYSKVIEVPGVSRANLLAAGRKYYLNTIGGKSTDITLDDKEAGLIEYKNLYIHKPKGFFNGLSELTYEVKMKAVDGKFKVSIIPVRWTEFSNYEERTVSMDCTIPFPESTGLIGKSTANKNRIQYYEDIDNLFSGFMNKAADYINKEGKKLSEEF
jgi:hypothetical protein